MSAPAAHALSIEVALPKGPQAIGAEWTVPADAAATVALTHGAGTGREHPFLAGLATALHRADVATLVFDLPYRAAGRRMPGPAAHAVAAWRAVFARLDVLEAPGPRVAAGKSYGGRMASMAAAEGAIDPAGLVYLGYPLHPPGSPDTVRAAHLPDIAAPQLFVSGTRDPFVDPHNQLDAVVATCPRARIAWIEGGDHSFAVAGRRSPADVIGAGLAPLVAEFARSLA
ncbi:alpha/beta family hydrolase [Microbacterium sp. NPDC091313]